jgi:DNA-binding NarL/FixJ family response regulator
MGSSAHGGTVVIADGDSRSRAVAAGVLRDAGYDPVEFGTGREVFAAVRQNGVAAVLLEVTLPDMTGWEVCRELRDEVGDGLPILFLSGSRRSADRIAGLLLGADDFIVRPVSGGELVARLRRFVSRRESVHPVVGDNGGSAPQLTEREQQILLLLAQGVRQKEIAGQLSISPKTVGTHIQNLLKKLDVHSRAELVARAWSLELVRGTAV